MAAYAGVGTEPPTRSLLDALRDDGSEVWLPIVVGRALHWAPYEGWDRLDEGPAGLLEPPRSGCRPRLPGTVSLWLVPALAVDRTGIRLGRGGGYYDRALADADADPAARTVAVVFEAELVDRLPRDVHDVPVGAALLPSGLVRLGDPTSAGDGGQPPS